MEKTSTKKKETTKKEATKKTTTKKPVATKKTTVKKNDEKNYFCDDYGGCHNVDNQLLVEERTLGLSRGKQGSAD